MKKTNTIVCGIAFAIPVIYFAVQAFLDKKYLFLILAAMGMIFLAGQMKKIYANESAMTESAQGIWAERETDICIALTALLWVSYICVNRIEQIPDIFSGYMFYIWIAAWLAVCALLDGIKVSLITIHLKAAAGILLSVFIPRILKYDPPVLLTQGYLAIIGMAYLVSLKRYLRRGFAERKGLKFKSLYRCTAVLLFCFTLFAVFQKEQLEVLLRNPLSVVRIHWIVPAVMTVVAVILMTNTKNRAERCLAGMLFLILLYYLAFQVGWVTVFSVTGMLSSCLFAGWLAEMLEQQGIMRGAAGIPVFYMLWLPGAYLLTESIVKGKYVILFLVVLAVLLIKESVDGTDVAKKRSIGMVLMVIPYQILIFEYGSRENRNMLPLAGMTLAVLLAFVVLINPKENSWKKPTAEKKFVETILICCFILTPLLAAAGGIRQDRKYVECFPDAAAETLTVGTGITINLNGFEEETTVKLDWGDGQVEELQGNTGLETEIKSGHLKITAGEGEEERSFHQFFLLWDMASN